MMDIQKVNGVSPKENGSHRRPPCYSVETPYGFHLDLDFLKYVDDIEKGNTIRRVPIQRRQRGRSSGSLSRNLSLPGYGCRPSQWNSTSILFPKPRLADSQQHYEFQSADSGSAGFTKQVAPSYGSFTTAEMDATIQAFDEQPLGLHVRPNLLRASSLPLTVLLRKRSESTDDPISPNGSRDYLTQENGSSEDVFHSPDRKSGRVNGTLQRLTAALQRVGELEEEIRVIPELKAQICILQEEREMLMHQFQTDAKEPLDPTSDVQQSVCPSPSPTHVSKAQSNANDDWMNREYDQLEENVKASSDQVDAIVIPSTPERKDMGTERNMQVTKVVKENQDLLDHGDRSKSLTETLQRKVVMLEQKLHELEYQLDKTQDQLEQQVQQNHMKDKRIKDLTRNAEDVWVRAEGTAVRPDSVRKTQEIHLSPENTSEKVQNPESYVSFKEGVQPHASRGAARSHADMEHHVKRVKELLHEQWECLCRKESSGTVLSSEHLPPHVCSIQEQLLTLVSLLSLYISPAGEEPPPAQESKMEDQKSMEERPVQDNPTCRSGEVKDDIRRTIRPKEEAHPKISEREAALPELSGNVVSTKDQKVDDSLEAAHAGGASKEMMEQTDETDCPDEQSGNNEDMHGNTCSEDKSKEPSEDEGGRERSVDKDFMAACYFLEDNMNEVSDPNEEMRQALTVVFQQWFHVSAEEDSCADTVAMYLSEVAMKTPTVLQFLVNMVDDNGNTALHYSVSHSNLRIVRLLLDTGVCEVDLRNKIGYTAIMLAAFVPVDSPEDVKVIQKLMELGDVNARAGQVGQTALHLAVRHGRVSTVRLLLANGANVNAQDRAGTTALISACDRGHIDIIRLLLEDPDCDVNLTDKGGRSALSLATQASHTEIADLLKARANSRGLDRCKMA